MSNNINQFNKVKSLLKDVPTIMQRPGFGLSGEYEVSNIHFNINPINNVSKLVNFISRYYDKNKKQFINIKDEFWDLAWNIYYFKFILN
ncbi:hypothetical protein R7Y11_01400 [Mesomycoplasma ovipneumoniae]|uniref:hypothetical protein n=1 Tax=Mesomycoplasma ovipneumoniae TaxID=29562 RepID=UPI0029642873|nr:hypothetical protein [Mesomycoplasma ovipneumoniae]MDW2924845.1 hypothetical protein [Mesomycoplasma ovipneumoniae]